MQLQLSTKIITLNVVGLAVIAGGLALAQRPKENVNPAHHPNIAAAQKLSEEAYQKLIAAQQANEWDMAGHAQKAKNLLEQANNQMKMAATAANRNK